MNPSPAATLYALLSASNEALLCAKTVAEVYQGVCNAAVSGGGFLSAAIALPNRSGWLRVQAAAGLSAEALRATRISIDDATDEGQDLVGTVWRSLAVQISRDVSNNAPPLTWRALAQRMGATAAAAVPLAAQGQAVGVLLVFAATPEALTAETVTLLDQLARHIVFALTSVEREAERTLAEQALVHRDEAFHGVLESLDDAYYEVDLRGRPVYHNNAFLQLLGYTAETIKDHDNRDRQTPEMAVAVFRAFNEVYRTGLSKTNQEWEYLRKDGSRVRVEGSVLLVRDAQGKPVGFRGILRDITQRRLTERALRESEARFRALTQLSSDWYWEKDADLRLSRIECRDSQLKNNHHPALGERLCESVFSVELEGGREKLQEQLLMREPFRDVVMHLALEDGTASYISLSGEPVFDPSGRFMGYRGVSRTITALKRAEARIDYVAQHDMLTGLPNRQLFGEMLAMLIRTGLRYQRKFAVCLIDIDRFKRINDALGHATGDALLKELAQRFQSVVRGSDLIARLGGDEFAVLLQEVHTRDQAAAVARKLIDAAAEPIILNGQECRVTASIGVVLFPHEGQDEQTLMKNADVAMYHAKDQGKNNFQFHAAEINAQAAQRMAMEVQLRHALERQELSVHYQAKLCLRTQKITGVEALLRWNNPVLGVVSPAQFIPVAEETGLITTIGLWVLETACAQNVAWQHLGLPPITMAVNLSMRQFADERLFEKIEEVLCNTGLEPTLLELEITEGMLAHNTEHAQQVLHALKALEVRLAVDDFGTGYSSLGQLKNFPIDTLKIDRSFVRDLAHNPQDKAITAAIIVMARALGLKTVAEGVETQEQQDYLCAQGCDEMQGYLFCKPMPHDAMAALLKRMQGREAPERV